MSIPSHMVFILVMLLFVFGASIGSFLCALASRLDPKRRETNLKQVFLSRSHCDSCMKQLSNWELIPVFSYLVQKGKCTKCKYKIPASFFIVELLTGIITVLFFLKWFSNPLTPLLIIFFKIGIAYIFIYFAYYDYLYWEIPLNTVIIISVSVLLYLLGGYIFSKIAFTEFIYQLGAGFIGMGAIALVILASKGKGLGWGDVWIFGLVGFLLGIKGLVEVFFISVFFGAAVGILKIALKSEQLKNNLIQFVPFIALGVVISTMLEGKIFMWLFPVL